MYIEDIWYKYVEEPAIKRESVDLKTRLQYTHTKETAKYKQFLIPGVTVIAGTAALLAFELISNFAFFVIEFFAIAFLWAVYVYQIRKCRTCGESMVRQETDSRHLYYFCDKCKTKFDTGVVFSDGSP